MEALPHGVWHFYIFPMLDMYDVCKLDTAMTNRKMRKTYKKALRNSSLHCDPFRKVSRMQLKWLWRKYCTVASFGIHLSSDNIEEELARKRKEFVGVVPCPDQTLERVSYLKGLFSHAELNAIGRLCPNLKHLRMKYSRASETWDQMMPNVTELHISVNSVNFDTKLQEILSHFPNLRCLKFPSFTYRKCCPGCHCYCLSNIGLEVVLQHCPQIEEIDMSQLIIIPDIPLTLSPGYSRNLRKLNLTNCDVLNDKLLVSIAQVAPNLKDLYLSSNPFISSEGLLEVLEYCSTLQVLRVANCFGVGDALLDTLSQWPRLSVVELDVSFCELVTQDAIQKLANSHPYIQVIYDEETPKIQKLLRLSVWSEKLPYVKYYKRRDMSEALQRGNERLTSHER